MEEHLIGYLLKTLDPETHRQTQAYLDRHPEAQQKLEVLRQGLQPLAWDKDTIDPPQGLVIQTLAHVAEYCCRDLPKAPEPPKQSIPATFRFPLWRRMDVLIAASLLMAVMGVGIPWIVDAREKYNILMCQDNLKDIYTGLNKYREEHGDKFPSPKEVANPPRDVAGLIVPMLVATGYLSKDFVVKCSANRKPTKLPINYDTALKLPWKDFLAQSEDFTPGYGYSLGYIDDGGVYQGPRYDPKINQITPLMADAPPPDAIGNSLNHNRHGQNILFQDGHVVFHPTPKSGPLDDDVYCNKNHEQKAGMDSKDIVIGHSRSHP